MNYDLIIVGGGASGLAAAYKAASFKKKLHILVLEKETVLGRKLSASGNGKCNVTNREFSDSCYHSEDTNLMKEWVTMHSYEEIPSFFDELGIMLYQNNGYFYPVSNQGKQVTNLLYEKSRQLGVTFSFGMKVSKVEVYNDFYRIEAISGTETISYEAKYVIMATGGKASPKLGGSSDGYLFGKQLKLAQRAVYPVLSPIYLEDEFLYLAKGVRIDAVVTLKGAEDLVIKEAGQVQFNDNSLSGIVIMNFSSYINARKNHILQDTLCLDVLPNTDWNSLKEYILLQKEKFPDETVDILLSGMLTGNFIKYILKRIRLGKDILLKDLTDKQINRITSTLKKLTFTPVWKEDYDKAQATGGGIRLSEINIQSFECKKYKNFYITGELLDVDGKCGGYNITFAMLSGIAAASDIVRKCQND